MIHDQPYRRVKADGKLIDLNLAEGEDEWEAVLRAAGRAYGGEIVTVQANCGDGYVDLYDCTVRIDTYYFEAAFEAWRF
jgi:hypothetical protein